MSSDAQYRTKRRYRRKTIRILVEYTVDGVVRSDYATTLGVGGMFLESPLPLTKGTLLTVKFRLPKTTRSFEIASRVVWIDETLQAVQTGKSKGMGIEFLDIAACTDLARELDQM